MTDLDAGVLVLFTNVAVAAILVEIAVSVLFLKDRWLAAVANGVAGLCLVLALRSALTGSTGAIAAMLMLSFVAHLADLRLRAQ